ncbi:glycoside hydrolase family 88 protein [Solitalea lacus]|uniref:glycoside hydrolase family 88 protein n=1 Tax=Solitalea lacus TaxID=2911172 RepID=UPI001ED9E3D1|nr:glycoside hydrolase family 88 protein [Solitalea lacus]UKJ07446.1 glycoside hydrolase family 88 protein [Solitalea lacus]
MKLSKQLFKGLVCAGLILSGTANAQNAPKEQMKKLIDANLTFAAQQYKVLAQNVPASVMPKTYNAKDNKVITSDTQWWCSGFYPGTLLYIYEYTKDPSILQEAKQRLAILEKEKHFTGNHDLGFMMFCSFGNAYRLFGVPEYKTILDTSAASLSTRFRPSISAIQSWDKSKNFNCPVIIDNMMNLELLCWVSDNGGDPKYKNIAITHANTTLKNHFRPDYSSYHVLDYDLNTGKVLKKVTWQGAADSSPWSRGQGWGLYGYTLMYRFTKDQAYLNQARRIAQFILKHPNLPADMIPYWDFNAPGIPNTYRDASAGALIASALLELGQYVSNKERKQFVGAAEKMLLSLSSDTYRAKPGTNGGFILMHSTGALPFKSEVDVPLTYADYYFIEALLRYKKWYLADTLTTKN